MSYNFKDYIIWIQTDTTMSDDILEADGRFLESAERQLAYHYLLPSQKDGKWRHYPLQEEAIKNEGVSEKLKFYNNAKGEILLSSHFLSVDNKGRRVAYLFCANHSDDWDELNCLKQLAHTKGYELNEQDLQFIKRHVCPPPQKNGQLTISITIAMIFISLIILIFVIVIKSN